MKLRLAFIIAVCMGLLFNHSLKGQIVTELPLLITKAREEFKVPAIAVVVCNSKDTITSEIQGVRVYNRSQRATLKDFFHIGSCSKSVLAVIAGKLVEEGKIKWNTPFFELFPEIAETSVKEYWNITLEDLLMCKAGIKAYTSGAEIFPEIDSSVPNRRYEFAKYLLQLPPAAKYINGQFEFLYSNAGYNIATLMLEKVSQLSYEQLIELYMNKELNIETYIGFPNTYNADQPWGHMIIEGKMDTFPPDHFYKLSYLIQPAGDLSMSPLNYARFIQLNLMGLTGDNNFISSSTYQYIHFGHKVFSLGVGNGKMYGHEFSGMDGSAGTFFCRAILVPDSDFAFVIMTNMGTGTGQMKAVNWLTMKIIKEQYNWWWKFWM
jgi:CubicO group peptidase (beta-lactamase class C family)